MVDGILVDTVERNASTGFLHMERCKLQQNKGGGLQWTGQVGVVERCGIYGNGVYPKGSIIEREKLKQPKPVAGAYGILVKNVKSMSHGMLISGCEIQGNADVQVMIEIGANIRIVQNEFSADDLSDKYSFPSIDIEVGDGNLGDTTFNFQDVDVAAERIGVPMPSEGAITLSSTQYKKKIIELTGILAKPGTVVFPSDTPDGSEWIIINNTNALLTLKADSGTKVNVPSVFERAIYKDKVGYTNIFHEPSMLV
jgi:hypothetical protein